MSPGTYTSINQSVAETEVPTKRSIIYQSVAKTEVPTKRSIIYQSVAETEVPTKRSIIYIKLYLPIIDVPGTNLYKRTEKPTRSNN
jgi:hypothetical protein